MLVGSSGSHQHLPSQSGGGCYPVSHKCLYCTCRVSFHHSEQSEANPRYSPSLHLQPPATDSYGIGDDLLRCCGELDTVARDLVGSHSRVWLERYMLFNSLYGTVCLFRLIYFQKSAAVSATVRSATGNEENLKTQSHFSSLPALHGGGAGHMNSYTRILPH